MNGFWLVMMVLSTMTVYSNTDSLKLQYVPSFAADLCEGAYYDHACVNKGDRIEFGRYFQSDEKTKEPLQWRVLDVDKDKHELFLLSEYVIDAKPYHHKKNNDINITWKNCSLRKWLNGDFIKLAFDKDAQKRIITTHLSDDETDDKVFLLSGDDTLWSGWGGRSAVFTSDEDEIAFITKYAYKQGVLVCFENSEDYVCDINKETRCKSDWWLRSVPNDDPLFVGVSYFENMDGVITDVGCARHKWLGVRPAMRVKY